MGPAERESPCNPPPDGSHARSMGAVNPALPPRARAAVAFLAAEQQSVTRLGQQQKPSGDCAFAKPIDAHVAGGAAPGSTTSGGALARRRETFQEFRKELEERRFGASRGNQYVVRPLEAVRLCEPCDLEPGGVVGGGGVEYTYDPLQLAVLEPLRARWVGKKVVHVFSGGLRLGGEGSFTQDLRPDVGADSNKHPVQFLRELLKSKGTGYADVVVFDAPPNQLVLKRYLASLGPELERKFHCDNRKLSVGHGDAGLARACKELLAKLLKPDGEAVCIAYKSAGFGKEMGFRIDQLVVVPHVSADAAMRSQFSCHDTVVVVERRGTTAPRTALVGSHGGVHVSRMWCMYASGGETFKVPSLAQLIDKYVRQHVRATGAAPVVVDPFARQSRRVSPHTITNDLNKKFKTHFNEDAAAFLARIGDPGFLWDFEEKRESSNGQPLAGHVDMILLDPPYSDVQSGVCYQGAGVQRGGGYTVNAGLYGRCRRQFSRLLRPNSGVVLTFGWSSVGVLDKCGARHADFQLLEVHLCAHGAAHDDTIVTVECYSPRASAPPSPPTTFPMPAL